MIGAASQTVAEPGELPAGVDLWSLSPNLTTKRFRTPEPFAEYVNGLAGKSSARANLIIWIDLLSFASMNFWYPSFEQWIRHGVILSGSGDRSIIGIVFSNYGDVRWGRKVIWSESGGPGCGRTCGWIVKKMSRESGKFVCDPYAKSHQLASRCRRLNIEYRGYTRYQAVRDDIEKELAQLELPGIQEELSLLIKNGE